MFDHEDIKILVRAKKDRRNIFILELLAFLCFLFLVISEAGDVFQTFTTMAATLGMVLLAARVGANKWVSISRDQLIYTLERLANKDPAAIEMLSRVSANGVK